MGRTVLVGLDGASFSVLDPLMATGVMPFLAHLATAGVRGELASTMPAVSPAAWTSIATGRSPGEHGVFDFIRAEERQQEVYFTLYDSRDIAVETIWSLLSARGFRVTVLNYMLTFPPPPIDGYLAPGLVPWRHLRRGMRPESLYETVRGLLGAGYREMAWDFGLEKKVLRGVQPDEYEEWIRLHIRRERHWFEVTRRLMSTDLCDLTAVVFDGVDKLQHTCWRFLDPQLVPSLSTAWERRIRDLCLDYFRDVDGYLAEIARLAGPDARMFIVSDHGFGPTGEVFRVNVWLHEHGYLQWADHAVDDAVTRRSVERRLDSNFALVDWERTTAYAPTPSCNGIVLRDAGRSPANPLAPRYTAMRQELMDGLRSITSPMTGLPVVRRVLTREEAFPGARMHQAPDLYLELADHGFVSIRNLKPVVELRPETAGTHRPEGIFLAAGPGIRRGGEITGLRAIDVAPMLLQSVGTAVPSSMEGQVPAGLFDGSVPGQERVPVPVAAASASRRDQPRADDGIDAEGEAAVLRRLADLGYIEW